MGKFLYRPSIPEPMLIPANEANPFNPLLPPDELPLEFGINMEEAVYVLGVDMATKTPITAAITADLIINFLPAQTLEIKAIDVYLIFCF